jgi:hypothetical protein
VKAFEAVGKEGEAQLAEDIRNVYSKYNRSGDGSGKFEAVYLQSIATRA